jgi:hypothetical protein
LLQDYTAEPAKSNHDCGESYTRARHGTIVPEAVFRQLRNEPLERDSYADGAEAEVLVEGFQRDYNHRRYEHKTLQEQMALCHNRQAAVQQPDALPGG